VNRKPNFDDLVGTETRGAERERLRGAHDLLLQAGPPPELTPRLEKAPDFGVTRLQARRPMKRRATLLLAAALSILAVFAAGYGVANHRNGGGGASSATVATLALTGTSNAPRARATLEVWKARAGNWPMTLSVAGLPRLAPHRYYEVYLVRNGRPWGSCGTFRVDGTGAVKLTLNAPYSLRTGDSWVVTRPGPNGSEPGSTVLRPVTA
jgi:anti-sigma-K factor RskA